MGLDQTKEIKHTICVIDRVDVDDINSITTSVSTVFMVDSSSVKVLTPTQPTQSPTKPTQSPTQQTQSTTQPTPMMLPVCYASSLK